jgi:hypothetical protein
MYTWKDDEAEVLARYIEAEAQKYPPLVEVEVEPEITCLRSTGGPPFAECWLGGQNRKGQPLLLGHVLTEGVLFARDEARVVLRRGKPFYNGKPRWSLSLY